MQELLLKEQKEQLAEEIFDWCCAHRFDNLDKNKRPTLDPRKVSSGWADMSEMSKSHYRNIVNWFLTKINGGENE